MVTSGASISTARFEERDGGVYVELEAIALSRDVPVRWIVNPIVRRVSRNSMLVSLQQMKEAVNSTEAAKTKSAVPTIAANPSRGAVASGVGNRLVPRQKP